MGIGPRYERGMGKNAALESESVRQVAHIAERRHVAGGNKRDLPVLDGDELALGCLSGPPGSSG